MNITLRKIKIIQKLSEETLCYTAELCVDGVKVADASNRGTGGSDDFFFEDEKARKQVEDYAKSLPPHANPYDAADPFPADLEWLVSNLLEKYEAEQHDKKVLSQKNRWCNKATVFRLKGDKAGSYRTVSKVYGPDVKAFLIKKHGDLLEEIVNEGIVTESEPEHRVL